MVPLRDRGSADYLDLRYEAAPYREDRIYTHQIDVRPRRRALILRCSVGVMLLMVIALTGHALRHRDAPTVVLPDEPASAPATRAPASVGDGNHARRDAPATPPRPRGSRHERG